MKPQLTRAHFQLTGNCNLACSFCGQHKGMLVHDSTHGLPVAKWLSLADELQSCAGVNRVSITLWGGEPLLYPGFDELAKELHQRSIRVTVISNGTLMDQHMEILASCMDGIHLSVDGMQEEHDAIRGAGVFEKLARNIAILNPLRRGSLTFLTTLSEANLSRPGQLARLCHELITLGPDAITLQPLMYLTKTEIENYRNYSRARFHCDYKELSAWQRDDDRNYLQVLKREVDSLKGEVFPIPVVYTPHHYHDLAEECQHCQAPWTRVHIRFDGEVGFCTDYFNFSAGNVTKTPLRDIFFGARAELFRQAVRDDKLPTCSHCPWRKQKLISE